MTEGIKYFVIFNEKAMATRNECHLSQLLFGWVPTNCEKKSQKESNYMT